MLRLEEEKGFDKQRDKRSGNDKELSKAEKQLLKERAERERVREENSKRESLKPFVDFEKDPLGTIKYLCEQGDFQGGYDKRMELFQMITMVQIQKSLKELISVLKSRK
ncbi:unnamed protein product [marine sediment metagenome]|uniref:Uncharacterized protein n=1 Tax=marine sediment metagenome TaxID=412755 RepID=X1UAD0_9ZZZZ